MTEPQETQPLFPRVQEYFQKSVVFIQPAHSVAHVIRTVIKWIFDFVRNLMIVGILLFLGMKTGNAVLKNVAIGGLFLLAIQIFSYIDTWTLSPFHLMKNKKLAGVLDFVVYISVVAFLSIGSIFLVTNLLQAIANSYLQASTQ